jgi:hypothetical protein
VWFGNEMLAELRHEDGSVRVQIYDAWGGAEYWDLPYEDVLAALQKAREELGPAPSGE